MTTIRKSDAQLDAEADSKFDIGTRIAVHRLMCDDDANIARLTTNAPPVFTQMSGERKSDPMSQLGPTVSWPLMSFVSYRMDERDGRVDTPAPSFPWAVGMASVRYHCRKNHYNHTQRPEWEGSLCWALVNRVVRYGDPLNERTCFYLWVDQTIAEQVLHKAFDRIEQKIDELHAKQTEVVKVDTGRNDWQTPSHVHQPLEGLHAEDCRQCQRGKDVA